ncbi:MAG: bifunctional precorrin-2 dehydrogenase/sirohydrochlorin ferrochelatase [Sphingobacteriales bacterium]|nr:MAG: bifunctional precorrin-2 dehydrogenase/sirohydrochlorin ferrochelatase [Sphingobacteriales bacterium]
MTPLPEDNRIQPVQDDENKGNQLFPVFVKLNNLHLVLIGAGKVGLEKLTAVLNNSPFTKVTVIAKDIIPEMHALAAEYTGVKIINKSFAEYDLDGADIVMAATNDNDLNVYIRQAAHDRKLLVNIADKPDLCDFYLGSVVQKGDLKIGISTNGKSPTFAKRVRELLEETLPDSLDNVLDNLKEIRDQLKGDFEYKVNKLNEITSIFKNKK